MCVLVLSACSSTVVERKEETRAQSQIPIGIRWDGVVLGSCSHDIDCGGQGSWLPARGKKNTVRRETCENNKCLEEFMYVECSTNNDCDGSDVCYKEDWICVKPQSSR